MALIMTDATSPDERPLMALAIRLGAAFTLSVMLVFVKLASESGVHLGEILFWRQMPTVPILLAWYGARGSIQNLATKRIGIHFRRAMLGLTGMFLNFGAVTLLPLAEATSLNFTSALWAVILSALILHERVGIWRWTAVLLGFFGVLVITQPGSGHIPPLGAAVALSAAFMIALTSIQIRDLGRTENAMTIVFYFSLFSLPVLGIMLPFVMTGHTLYEWSILGGLALFGLLGQFLLTLSLRYGAVATVIVMDYSGLIWATLFGWAVFDHLPPYTTWLGAPLIITAGAVIAWREHYLARKRRTGAKPAQHISY